MLLLVLNPYGLEPDKSIDAHFSPWSLRSCIPDYCILQPGKSWEAHFIKEAETPASVELCPQLIEETAP